MQRTAASQYAAFKNWKDLTKEIVGKQREIPESATITNCSPWERRHEEKVTLLMDSTMYAQLYFSHVG